MTGQLRLVHFQDAELPRSGNRAGSSKVDANRTHPQETTLQNSAKKARKLGKSWGASLNGSRRLDTPKYLTVEVGATPNREARLMEGILLARVHSA
jgi:hypothetical protein